LRNRVDSNQRNQTSFMTSRPSFGHIRRDRPYQAGRSKHWVKVKNRQHPAINRVMESFR
jgi:hypothetical protein